MTAFFVHGNTQVLHRTKELPVMSTLRAINSVTPTAWRPAVRRAPDVRRRQLRAITVSPTTILSEKYTSTVSTLKSTSSSKLSASTLTEPQRHAPTVAPTNPKTEAPRHIYPAVHFEGHHVEVLSAEPPVYLAKDCLGEEMCQALISSAEAGSLEPVDYEQKVLVNTERLKLLMPLVVVAAVPPMLSSFEGGATALEVAATGAAALLAASGAAAALTLAVRRCVEEAIGGRVFVGNKWAGASAQGDAESAVESAIAKIEKITGRSRACFEPTLVTRYRPGDRQRRHFDTPLPGDESLEDFESSGLGQRLVQCVVYLNDLPEGGGGETMFHHPDLSGLKVVPSKGDCLFFFPCFADGEADLRMEHSGEPVRAGTKYILNTWVCQNGSAGR